MRCAGISPRDNHYFAGLGLVCVVFIRVFGAFFAQKLSIKDWVHQTHGREFSTALFQWNLVTSVAEDKGSSLGGGASCSWVRRKMT